MLLSMRIQFIASDTGTASTVEVAVDDITIVEAGVRGDFNADDVLTSSDLIAAVSYVFKSGPAPDRFARADADGDCDVSSSDIIFWVNRIFTNDPEAELPCQCMFQGADGAYSED